MEGPGSPFLHEADFACQRTLTRVFARKENGWPRRLHLPPYLRNTFVPPFRYPPLMANLNKRGYYRRPKDHLMWDRFDKLARRLRTNVSALITEAAREYLERHGDDQAPEAPVPRDRRRKVVDHDPFEKFKDAPTTPLTTNPFS